MDCEKKVDLDYNKTSVSCIMPQESGEWKRNGADRREMEIGNVYTGIGDVTTL